MFEKNRPTQRDVPPSLVRPLQRKLPEVDEQLELLPRPVRRLSVRTRRRQQFEGVSEAFDQVDFGMAYRDPSAT